ncbi:hypothetical protein [Streptomyces violens]|uniref:hypothetical protein n=1 Tax=Streptomyces violens TaxID=66377 RepID=UPI0004C1EBD5|nr:hypothetical protein [Streptomyces violens]
MPPAPRTRQQPRISRETATQVAGLAGQIGLSTARVLEMLLMAYTSKQITMADCPPYIRSGVDRRQLDVEIDEEVWRRADQQRKNDDMHSMGPLCERLLSAYANGTFTIGVVRTPQALVA